MVSPSSTSFVGRDATILNYIEASTSTGHTGQSLPPQDATRMLGSGGVCLAAVVSPAFLSDRQLNFTSRIENLEKERAPSGNPLRWTPTPTPPWSVRKYPHPYLDMSMSVRAT
ncbi:hypothetical protein VPNG_05462 [Cytospora leucostoma]|uniref:Uncharacterized protein n=1 Tax=Cytospora leucostoma TaxID=1230097 RepID=A0A423XBM6_9PEZI|nr:hypothetical protein VPNG_05462 [Cytospora leucostoma]